MYNEVIKLIAENKTVNEYGDLISEPVERLVFAKCVSIGANEFYQAKGVGLKPDIKFILPDYLEYHGELTLKYCPFDGEEDVYTIYRTYRAGNELELTCKRGID